MSRSTALCSACLVCLGLWIVSNPIVLRFWSGLTGPVLIGPTFFDVLCFILAAVFFIIWQRERRSLLVLAGVCLTWNLFLEYLGWYIPNPVDPSNPHHLWSIFLVAISNDPAFYLGLIFLLIWLCLRFREQRRRGTVSQAFWYTLGWFIGFVFLSIYMATHASRPVFLFVSLPILLPLFIAWLVGWSGDWRSPHWLFGISGFSGEGESKELLGGLKGGGLPSEWSLLVPACLVCFGLWAISTLSVLLFWISPSSFVLWMGDLCLGGLCFILAEIFFIVWQRERRSLLVLAGVCLTWVWIATYLGRYIPNSVAPSNPYHGYSKLYPGAEEVSLNTNTSTTASPFVASYIPAFWLGFVFLVIWLCLRFIDPNIEN